MTIECDHCGYCAITDVLNIRDNNIAVMAGLNYWIDVNGWTKNELVYGPKYLYFCPACTKKNRDAEAEYQKRWDVY